MKDFKAIIFDWSGTLWDYDSKEEFPESERVLNYYKTKKFKLAVASLADFESEEKRVNRINKSKLKKYFDIILVTAFDKDKIIDQIVKSFDLPKDQILIVDDRMVRGIKYGIKNGFTTVWLQKGRYAEEMPNTEIGQPTYTIHSLEELYNII